MLQPRAASEAEAVSQRRDPHLNLDEFANACYDGFDPTRSVNPEPDGKSNATFHYGQLLRMIDAVESKNFS